jgi:hypothetical protein
MTKAIRRRRLAAALAVAVPPDDLSRQSDTLRSNVNGFLNKIRAA